MAVFSFLFWRPIHHWMPIRWSIPHFQPPAILHHLLLLNSKDTLQLAQLPCLPSTCSLPGGITNSPQNIGDGCRYTTWTWWSTSIPHWIRLLLGLLKSRGSPRVDAGTLEIVHNSNNGHSKRYYTIMWVHWTAFKDRKKLHLLFGDILFSARDFLRWWR